MVTQVVMQRMLFGSAISQQSKTEFFSATDLVKAGNQWRAENKLDLFNLNSFLNNKSTKDFINELEKEFGKCKINSKGKNQHTWVHPYLFIKISLAINPKLEVEVYKWLFDELLKYRNNSGDSYKKMTGALWNNTTRKDTFAKSMIKVAEIIREACNVTDWQTASESQLKLRDRIHENISLLSDVLKDNNQAIRIGIKKALES
jgi:hypothetical protein